MANRKASDLAPSPHVALRKNDAATGSAATRLIMRLAVGDCLTGGTYVDRVAWDGVARVGPTAARDTWRFVRRGGKFAGLYRRVGDSVVQISAISSQVMVATRSFSGDRTGFMEVAHRPR